MSAKGEHLADALDEVADAIQEARVIAAGAATHASHPRAVEAVKTLTLALGNAWEQLVNARRAASRQWREEVQP